MFQEPTPLTSAGSSPRCAFAIGAEEVAPPVAEHPRESIASLAVPGRVILGQRRPAAMLEGHLRAATLGRQQDLDLGPLVRLEVRQPPLENEARARLP
jgi:hypothetical protein